MIRRMIHIDQDLCNGCGLCAAACHEGAIGMEQGKATLLRDDYCDGLGDCLPVCPTGAITFEEREAAAYDEAAVRARQEAQTAAHSSIQGGCPGSRAHAVERSEPPKAQTSPADALPGELRQWPVQIQLVPLQAPYFAGADLLIAADCAAYAYAGFHRDFIRGHITLIGCPKLDRVDYAEKLTGILRLNQIRSVTIVRMEVPCCAGLVHAATHALEDCGKSIPCRVVTLSTGGEVWVDL